MGPHEYQRRQREWLSPHALLHYDRRRLRRMNDPVSRLTHALLCDVLKRVSPMVLPSSLLYTLRVMSMFSGAIRGATYIIPVERRLYNLEALRHNARKVLKEVR